MAAISHLKNIRGQLATAFGIHLVQGYNVLEDVTATGASEPQIVVVQVLGDGHGAGWDGPQQMTYRGHELDPSAYHFHPGTFSRGDADPVQGVDAWFPLGVTYSGTTYAVAKLPPGVASEGNASELQGIYRCLKLPNYNAAGQQIDRDGGVVPDGAQPEDYFYYSANPARVAAWLIVFGRGLSTSRVDWAAWVAWRDYCDELIDWVDGTTTEVPLALAWRSQGGMTVGSGGSATKGRDTSGVYAWDSGTTTEYACPVSAAGHRGVEFTINSVYGFQVGLTRATVLTGDQTYRALDVALYFEQGGALKLSAGGAHVGTLPGGWAGGQTYRVVDEAGVWKFYRDGAVINHAHSLPAPPAGALYGGVACNPQNSGVTSALYYPAASASSTQNARRIPRFEAHIAFTQPTSLQDALDQVCFVSCSDWQETPKIRFLTPQPAVELGAELHAAQRQIVHHFDATVEDNIVRRSISAYPLDVRERWNFAEALFRDLDNRDLIEDYVQDERAGLQDAAGDANTPRIISPGQINLGNMNRSQALRVLRWLMRLRSDRVWFCELKAAADSLHVLPGDVVRVSHATYNWVEKLFIVIDAVDEEEGADERSFVLQEYDPADYYHDTDHSRGQLSAAPPTPSPYQPPPPVVSVALEETQTPQADGTIISGIRGTVNFTNYVGKQLGRVYIKPSSAPDSQWKRAAAQLLKPQPDSGVDVFEIRGVEKIAYDVKVVSEAENTTQLPFGSHDTYSITIVGKQEAPGQPTGLSATMGENGMVVFSVNAPAEGDFSFMRVYDGTGAVVRPREAGTKWEEPPDASAITRKVTFFNTSGRESVFSEPYTYTLPSPVAPASAAATRDGANIVLRWTAVEGLDYQVSPDQSAISWQGKGGAHRVLGAVTGAATYTYYVRSLRFGVASAWAPVELVVSPPASPTGAALARAGQALVLTWTALAGFEYQVSADGSTPVWRGAAGSYRREGVVTGAATYTYYVRALEDGVPSAWEPASVVVGAPAAPGGVDLTRDRQALVLEWTAVEGFEYEVSANQLTTLWRGRAGSYRREGVVTAAGTYTYSVRAVDNGIAGSWGSDSVTVNAPSPPLGFAVVRSGRTFVATWAKADGYEYEYAADGSTPLWRGASGEYVETGIPAAAGSYTRWVRALDYGIPSAWAPFTVTVSAPQPPAAVAGAFDGANVVWTLTKSPSGEVVGYRARSAAGALLADDVGLEWKQRVTPGTTTYTVRFYAVDSLGIESATYAQNPFTVPAPSAPASASASFDGLSVVWKLAASPSAGVVAYRAKDAADALLADDVGLEWREAVSSGVTTYSRRFYAVDVAGQESPVLAASFTVPAPGAPTFALSTSPEALVHDVAPNASDPPPVEFEVARANDGTNVIERISDRGWLESLEALATAGIVSRSFTRYCRAINRAGRASAWVSASTTYQPITAAPTLTADTARANPVSLPVAVATPAARAYVRHVVLQVRAVGGAWPALTDGTSGTFRFPGYAKTITVPWEAGGSMEYRVALEDVLTQQLSDHVWTTTQSYTFPKFLDSAIDPSSNFLKKANYRSAIFKGGGEIEWTSGFLVKWSQPIVVDVAGIAGSANEVTLSANAAGTALAAGEAIIWRHVLGATTATAVKVTLSTYTMAEETSTTTEFILFRRNADNTLSNYLSQTLNAGEKIDASVHIPMLSSNEARLGNALITKASIKSAYVGTLVADVGDVRLVLADKMGSRNFVAAGDQTPQTELSAWSVGATLGAVSSDGSFTKTGAAGWNSGAVAARAIHAGAGAVSVALTATNTDRGVGFTFKAAVSALADFSHFIIAASDGNLYYSEAGGAQTALGAAYVAGDSIKLEYTGTQVVYKRVTAAGVETALRTVTTALATPARAGCLVHTAAASIAAPAVTGVLAPATGSKLRWLNNVGVSFDSADDLTGAGTGAWGGAGAFSLDSLAAGVNGRLSLKAGQTNKAFAVGFSGSDPNQSYSTIGYGVMCWTDGNLYSVEGPAANVNLGTYTTADEIAVERRSGNSFVVTKNGVVIRTYSSTYSGEIFADLAVYSPATLINSVRLARAGAAGQGVMIDCPGGTAEFSKAVKIGETTVDRVVAGSYKAVTPELAFRGNDYGPPYPHKVQAAKAYKWKYELSNPHASEVSVQLNLTLPAAGADVYANMDSVRRVWVKVLNRFGDVVADVPPMLYQPGGGLTAQFWHPLKYAHPADDATYEVRLENAYGWSLPFYVARGVYQQAAPSYFNKRDCPTEMCVASGNFAAWMPAQQNAGTQTLQYRLLGASAWTTYASNYLAGDDSTSIPGSILLPRRWYELRVGNNSVTGAYSNVVLSYVPEPARFASSYDQAGDLSISFTSPEGITARPVSQTTNRVALKNGGPSAGGLPVQGYDVYRDGAVIAAAVTGAYYDDTTASAGVTYEYQVRAGYQLPSGGAWVWTELSTPVSCTTASTLNATDPTGLKVTQISVGSIDLSWLLNGNTGAVALEYRSYDPNGAGPSDAGFWSSGVTTLSLTAGTASRSVGSLTSSTRYAFRVKAGTSNYTNVITADTLKVVGSY
ncbi:MAG TPA: fibronectin type III domain-containing protein [Pyrinomonadaceae bacterium]|jgi:hypothetical protein